MDPTGENVMDRTGTAWNSAIRWLAASWLVFAMVGPAAAAFHLFRINEVYSSADGTVQFVELKEATGSDFESFWMGQALTSTQGATLRTFIFPGNLPSTSTASKSVLVATPAFAAAAGISPDFVVPAPFLFPGGGTINYSGGNFCRRTRFLSAIATACARPRHPPISPARPERSHRRRRRRRRRSAFRRSDRSASCSWPRLWR